MPAVTRAVYAGRGSRLARRRAARSWMVQRWSGVNLFVLCVGVGVRNRRRGLESQGDIHHAAPSPCGFSDRVTAGSDDERGGDVIRDEQ